MTDREGPPATSLVPRIVSVVRSRMVSVPSVSDPNPSYRATEAVRVTGLVDSCGLDDEVNVTTDEYPWITVSGSLTDPTKSSDPVK